MTTPSGQRPFPIPLVSAMGPGSQIEDEELDYLPMPQGMSTYQPPRLPEPDALDGHGAAIAVLDQVLAVLQAAIRGESVAPVDLSGLGAADREIVNQALGEGEVGAQVADGQGSALVQVQESVFAGVWRVIERLPDGGLQDRIEVGAIPEVLKTCARQDGASGHRPAARLPEGVMNAPTLLQELHDHRQQWRVGQSAHLVNLSLLRRHDVDELVNRTLWDVEQTVLGNTRGFGRCVDAHRDLVAGVLAHGAVQAELGDSAVAGMPCPIWPGTTQQGVERVDRLLPEVEPIAAWTDHEG